MSSEAEAYLVVLVFVLLAAVILLSTFITFAYIWFKDFINENQTFTRLMIDLYEKEREKNERQDEGGTGF